jgi:hypothetical protein
MFFVLAALSGLSVPERVGVLWTLSSLVFVGVILR